MLTADKSFADVTLECGSHVMDRSISVSKYAKYTLPPFTVNANDRERILLLLREGANGECADKMSAAACESATSAAKNEAKTYEELLSLGLLLSEGSCPKDCPNFKLVAISDFSTVIDSSCTGRASQGDYLGDVEFGMNFVTFKGISCDAVATGGSVPNLVEKKET